MNPSTNAVVVTISNNDWLTQTFVYNAVASVFTGVVSGLLMSLIVWWIIRRIEKGDAFRDAVLPVLRAIEQTRDANELVATYKNTRVAIRDAAVRFSGYICRTGKRHTFNTTWRKYCGIDDRALEPKWEIEELWKDLPKIMDVPTYVEARDDIIRWLNILINLSYVRRT